MSSATTAVYRTLDKATKRLLTKSNLPKQPRSPVNFFYSEKSKGLYSGKKVVEYSDKTKELFATYRTMSDQERQRYIREAEQDKIRFKNEFNQWYSAVQGNDQLKQKLQGVAEALKEKYQRLGHL